MQIMKKEKQKEDASNKTKEARKKLIEKKKKNPNMIYSDEVGAVYCYVPKVACTNWKRIFQVRMLYRASDPYENDNE